MTLCCVVALPALALAVKGGANGSFLGPGVPLLAACTIAGRDRRPARSRRTRRPPGCSISSLSLPLASVILNQTVLGDFTWRVYDAPSRFILAVPAIWWLLRLPAPRCVTCNGACAWAR